MKTFFLDTNEPVTQAQLDELGVLYWNVPADTYDTDGILDKICTEQGYNYREIVRLLGGNLETQSVAHSLSTNPNFIPVYQLEISRATLPNYDEKMAIFYTEHIHKDDEIRYFLGGSGYFEVRSKDDRWIRIHCHKNDLIVLPAGIYHRFKLDEEASAKVMRLFQGVPVWTPFNRGEETDQFPERVKYVTKYLKQ